MQGKTLPQEVERRSVVAGSRVKAGREVMQARHGGAEGGEVCISHWR